MSVRAIDDDISPHYWQNLYGNKLYMDEQAKTIGEADGGPRRGILQISC